MHWETGNACRCCLVRRFTGFSVAHKTIYHCFVHGHDVCIQCRIKLISCACTKLTPYTWYHITCWPTSKELCARPTGSLYFPRVDDVILCCKVFRIVVARSAPAEKLWRVCMYEVVQIELRKIRYEYVDHGDFTGPTRQHHLNMS